MGFRGGNGGIALLASAAKTLEIGQTPGVKPMAFYNYLKLIYHRTGLNKLAALIEWAKDNGLDDPGLLTPGTLNVRGSRHRAMRGFFGLR